jgi:hypothetical protein
MFFRWMGQPAPNRRRRVLACVALVILLRISGKRTLFKMNAFDLIVTVALGSTLATVLLTKDVALAEGTLALALLIGLPFAVAELNGQELKFLRAGGERATPATCCIPRWPRPRHPHLGSDRFVARRGVVPGPGRFGWTRISTRCRVRT